MILSVHSSAEEMVASVKANDPGKHFPILRKTIQLIQSLFKKREQNKPNTKKAKKKKKISKERDRKMSLHKESKDLLPSYIWAVWIQSS